MWSSTRRTSAVNVFGLIDHVLLSRSVPNGRCRTGDHDGVEAKPGGNEHDLCYAVGEMEREV